MPFAIKAQGLSKEWAGKPLFEQVDFEIEEGEHVALFGRNGIGKTTLIRGLMNEVLFDSGTVLRRHPIDTWGWLEQHVHFENGMSLLSFVRNGQPALHGLRQRLDQLQEEMARAANGLLTGSADRAQYGEPNPTDWQSRLVEAYGQVHEQYLSLAGYDWEIQVEQTLTRFGFGLDHIHINYDHLSGGEKTRAQLARLVVRNPQLLILDEPTNHLDTETLAWLEEWLRQFKGTVLFVSHDRQFIDAVADAVLELRCDGMRRYAGGYTAFRTQRDLEVTSHQALYNKQQREKQHLLEAIRQYQQWYQQAHDAAGIDFHLRKKAEKNSTRFKAKERALIRLEAEMVERPKTDPSLRIDFTEGRFEAKTLVALYDVTFQYATAPLFEGLNLRVQRGDKIAVIGHNGAGKSTLLRLLTRYLRPQSGQVEHHPALTIGYFAQELEDLDLSQTVLDTLLSLYGMTQSYARTVLAGFLFPQQDVFKRVSDLSMGERCRVAFVKLYFSGANLLVLDEPTNYLDIDARERIEEALAAYPGALLMVSHDRYLVRKVANRILHLETLPAGSGTAVTLFPGPYDEWRTHAELTDEVPVDVRDRIRQLEYQLAQAIAIEPVEAEDNRATLLADIRRMRAELDQLKGS